MNAEETLAQLARDVATCTKCALHEARKKVVAGEGSANAEIMFIGEGPGFHEDEQGRPFVGASGKFLDQLLAQADITREDVFIANVVKCRPPGNRDPKPEELAMCDEYLEAQIRAINPSIIVTLGRISMGKYFPGAKITSVHGQMQNISGRFIIPMYHPAAALHQPALRPSILADFANLPNQLNEARQALGKKIVIQNKETSSLSIEKPKQLKLF
ncbi:MAG TPA: uracil-DNA glycosylase [Anaerolineales bacterium]|nr:uracil-DNA glycosylase [Anaerolineales bacterium]HNA89716.1 uracil-DNA glycosylase [Anaerolineales bacterium]HNB36672.1 uracil-DNA glycosylase [Anaerolineales bacterium]HNC08643.1 uracil-DNA glycosylase [Anaerolineales bacterium]HNH27415.1 uracil-DNA glycosylase [Anaerolineales bacterium]